MTDHPDEKEYLILPLVYFKIIRFSKNRKPYILELEEVLPENDIDLKGEINLNSNNYYSLKDVLEGNSLHLF